MNVLMFLLCDAATVRDGLINTLGGGVQQVNRPTYPAPLGVSAAVFIAAPLSELIGQHRLRVRVQLHGEGDVTQGVAEIGLEFTGNELSAVADEEATLPVVLPVQTVPLPREGIYDAILLFDEQELARLRLLAVRTEPEGANMPPGARTSVSQG